jgi:hypothetical protein
LNLARDNIGDEVKNKVCRGVLQLIAQDRRSESVEARELISKLVHVMLALDFYRSFEASLLSETRDHYRQAGTDAF